METYALVNGIKTYLEANLPAELVVRGLPACRQFVYGPLYVAASADLPQVGVDAEQYTQVSTSWGDEDDLDAVNMEVDNAIMVTFGVEGDTGPQVAQRIHQYADAIRHVLENDAATAVQALSLEVRKCEFSPGIRRSSTLFRFGEMEVEVKVDRLEGS